MADEVYVKYVSVDTLGFGGNSAGTEFALLLYSDFEEALWIDDWASFEEMREEVNTENIGDFIYDRPYLCERFWETIEQTHRVIWRNWPESGWVEAPIDPQKVAEKYK